MIPFREFLEEAKVSKVPKGNFDAFWKDYTKGVFMFDANMQFFGDSAIFEVKKFTQGGNPVILLSGIFVPPEERGKGQADKAMKWLMGLADKHGLATVLIPKPYGEGKKLTKAQLKKWYKKYGFKDQSGESMIRLPKENK